MLRKPVYVPNDFAQVVSRITSNIASYNDWKVLDRYKAANKPVLKWVMDWLNVNNIPTTKRELAWWSGELGIGTAKAGLTTSYDKPDLMKKLEDYILSPSQANRLLYKPVRRLLADSVNNWDISNVSTVISNLVNDVAKRYFNENSKTMLERTWGEAFSQQDRDMLAKKIRIDLEGELGVKKLKLRTTDILSLINTIKTTVPERYNKLINSWRGRLPKVGIFDITESPMFVEWLEGHSEDVPKLHKDLKDLHSKISGKLSPLQREYRKFFRRKLKDEDAKHPGELEDPSKFFKGIKREWPKHKKTVEGGSVMKDVSYSIVLAELAKDGDSDLFHQVAQIKADIEEAEDMEGAMAPYHKRVKKAVDPEERRKRALFYKKHKKDLLKEQRKYRKKHAQELKKRSKLYS